MDMIRCAYCENNDSNKMCVSGFSHFELKYVYVISTQSKLFLSFVYCLYINNISVLSHLKKH